MHPADDLAWRTSSRSGNGENCVEVAPTTDGVLIRHSKYPAAGRIRFTSQSWTAFMWDALGGHNTNPTASISPCGADFVVESLHTSVQLRFDTGEWLAFLAGIRGSEFDIAHMTDGRDSVGAQKLE
jgi:hypothetical protein